MKKKGGSGEEEAGKNESAKTQAHNLIYWLNENYFSLFQWSHAGLLMRWIFSKRFSPVVNNYVKLSIATWQANKKLKIQPLLK